ncbi:MAG: hypothetical protein HYX32_11625 [Actinobacteria bacterium]|nr:hypothetical protein [Actinomycetota bacterium]
MTKLFATDPSTGRSAYVTETAIGLALVALAVMIVDVVVHGWDTDTQLLGLAQLALALSSLVFGSIYLFRSRAARADGATIDLREPEPEPAEAPRQVPDARATRVFAR